MSFSSDQVAMTAAAALIIAANSDRIKITLKNTGANTVFVGDDASVTKDNGFPIGPNAILVDDSSTTAYYGICGTALTSTISVMEEDITGVN
jgi:hypothetical protein